MVHAHRSQAEIARRLKRHPATISRELRRNRSPHGYWASAAQAKAEARRSNRPWTCKMERPEVARYVRERLRLRWSPDEIAGRSRDDFPRDPHRRVSRQTIYTWIHSHRAAAYWRRYLRRLGRVRRRGENRGQLPACVSIEGRPAVVDRRARYGDWEGDTVVGRWHQGGAVTLVDRKSGCLLLGKVHDRQAVTVREAMTQLFQPLPARLRKTLTLDNGKEFAEHQQLAAETELKVYFAQPYCAWQRGTNEHTNGLIRQFFPKGTDLARIPERQLVKVQDLLNNRPRKRLGYRTPLEVLGSRLKPCD
jgi:IS30 family transposase